MQRAPLPRTHWGSLLPFYRWGKWSSEKWGHGQGHSANWMHNGNMKLTQIFCPVISTQCPAASVPTRFPLKPGHCWAGGKSLAVRQTLPSFHRPGTTAAWNFPWQLGWGPRRWGGARSSAQRETGSPCPCPLPLTGLAASLFLGTLRLVRGLLCGCGVRGDVSLPRCHRQSLQRSWEVFSKFS